MKKKITGKNQFFYSLGYNCSQTLTVSYDTMNWTHQSNYWHLEHSNFAPTKYNGE